jgi:hypothetical protein
MRTNPIEQKIEQMVGAYFEACKMQDVKNSAQLVSSGRGPFRKMIAFCADMNFASLTQRTHSTAKRRDRLLPANLRHSSKEMGGRKRSFATQRWSRLQWRG